ncbi:MAG: DUF418 domain-containing protein [Fimbriimonadaceae bacterium]|jgi:uncharacterized protein|nr:DUF418 domain-containing protein [Fimbriimonadaceae bacterium]
MILVRNGKLGCIVVWDVSSAVIRPTTKNRIASFDFLRGVAILGILLANIAAFASPSLASMMSGMANEPGPLGFFEALRDGFVSGKFRGMLAILFGVGLYLQSVKRSSHGEDWTKGYIRRTIWLLVLGLIHGIFIWWGDILFLYAISALVACFMVKLDDKLLLWIAGGVIGFYALLGMGGGLLFSLPAFSSAFAAGGEATDPVSVFMSAANEQRVYGAGTYLDQLIHRLLLSVVLLFSNLFMMPTVLGLMLFGIWVARSGVLANPSAHPEKVKPLFIVGAVALVLNLVPAIVYPMGVMISSFWAEAGLAYFASIFYLLVGALLVERFRTSGFVRAIANVGNVALSCYLMQSILCTFFFYSIGFGFFGKLDAIQQLAVVGVVWVINIVFANLWLSRFSLGPVEWLWRSVSEKRKLPLDRKESGEFELIPPPVVTNRR